MKKILYTLAATALLFTTGCDDFLDKQSYTDHDQEILSTPEGIRALLNGIYDQFSGVYYYGRHMYAYEACKGDDFFVRVSSGNSYERENRYAEATSSAGYAESSWNAIYASIRTATNLVEVVDGAGLEPAERDAILGEAKALRALAYFDLMRLFAYPPRFSMESGVEYNERYQWGVPIIKNMDMVNNIFKYEIRRETAETTFKYIETEMLEAQALLQDKATKQGHINYASVCALLARLYLYESRWIDVINQGEKAVTATAGSHALLTYDSYQTNYYQPFNTESLWELSYSLTDNLAANSLNYLVRKPTYNEPGAARDGQVSQSVGYAAYGLTTSARTALSQKKNGVNDVRSYLICDLGISTNPEYKGLRKYVGNPYHYVHNVPIVRLPEVYLTLAEAYLHMSDRTSAEAYYKKLREARLKDTSGFAATELSDCLREVLDERRRELILEGHNYWDCFRRGETIVRNDATIENLNKKNIAFGYGSGKANARAQVIYPIPLGELEANIAIRNQQNPGYDSYEDVYLD